MKKAKTQINVMRKCNLDVEMMINPIKTDLFDKVMRRTPFYQMYSETFADKLYEKINEGIDFIYIRKYFLDDSFIKIIKMLRKIKDDLKIILEIPTYPYDLEISRLIDWPIYKKDQIYRKRLQGLIDRIITFTNDEIIWGIKCINISNGIDVENIPKKIKRTNNDVIKFIGVASLAKWHGYDRLIKGIANYSKTKSIEEVPEFHIIGKGDEYKNLKDLVKKMNIGSKVYFHGFKSGQDLDRYFNESDIAVGSLGMFRIGLDKGYTLKLREYAVRGIPFIYGYDDDLIEKSYRKYSFKVSNNDNDIEIQPIIDFYFDLVKSNELDEIIDEMNMLAKKDLSWEKQMKPVIEYINN